jgi:hypothetical protein
MATDITESIGKSCAEIHLEIAATIENLNSRLGLEEIQRALVTLFTVHIITNSHIFNYLNTHF